MDHGVDADSTSKSGYDSSAPGVIADLLRDHELILRATVALERCVARLTSPGEIDRREQEHLATLLSFFREFTDGIHDAKEEEVLIPVLLAAGAEVDAGLVREVMDAHLQASRILAQATDARGERSLEGIARYTDAVRQHMRREEHGLFPVVHRLLDPESERRMLASFRQIEARGASGGKDHDWFAREVERLLAPLTDLYPDRKHPW